MPLSSERKKPDYDQTRGGVVGGGKAWVQTAHAPYGPGPVGNAPGIEGQGALNAGTLSASPLCSN